jgi:hypothetical protein
MSRLIAWVLFLCSVTAVSAEAGEPANISPGSYSGRAQEQGGPGWSDVDLVIKEVSADGRITAVVQAYRAGPTCSRPMPMSGQTTPDGGIRLEVKEGAPAGCERIYQLKTLPDGGLVGTSLFNGKTYNLQFKRR